MSRNWSFDRFCQSREGTDIGWSFLAYVQIWDTPSTVSPASLCLTGFRVTYSVAMAFDCANAVSAEHGGTNDTWYMTGKKAKLTAHYEMRKNNFNSPCRLAEGIRMKKHRAQVYRRHRNFGVFRWKFHYEADRVRFRQRTYLESDWTATFLAQPSMRLARLEAYGSKVLQINRLEVKSSRTRQQNRPIKIVSQAYDCPIIPG